MSDYTRKEQAAIREAFAAIERVCQAWDWIAPEMLRFALKHERSERGSVHAARALVVRCFAEGYREPKAPIASLYGVARGCQIAQILGAGVRHHADYDRERYGEVDRVSSGYAPLCSRFDFDRILALCDTCELSQRASIDRRLEAIK